MGQITVKAEAVLEAPTEAVYATIADYRQGHPNILPKELYDVRVEQGGSGAGTIYRFKMRVLGVEQSFYQLYWLRGSSVLKIGYNVTLRVDTCWLFCPNGFN